MIRDLLGGTALGGALVAIVDTLLMSGDLVVGVLGFVVATVDQWIPVVSLLSTYVAPETALIDQGTLQTVLLVLALVAVGIQVSRIISSRL